MPNDQPSDQPTSPSEQPKPKSPPPIVPDPKTMMTGKKSQDDEAGKETAVIKIKNVERRSD